MTMIKRASGIISIVFLIAGLAGLSIPAGAETGRRFSVGANVGGGSVGGGFQSWRAGFELGYRAGKNLAVAADVAYGALTLESTSSASGYEAKDSQTWTIAPISLSVFYAAALNESATAYLGAGLGYNLLSRTVESEIRSSGQPWTESYEEKFHALAPQVVVALELGLGKSASLVGALTYVFGTASREETEGSLTATQDINFGGASLTLSVRCYLF
jgi:opacity protein-like surface antigen